MELILFLFDLGIVFTYGSLMATVEKFSCLVVESIFLLSLARRLARVKCGRI